MPDLAKMSLQPPTAVTESNLRTPSEKWLTSASYEQPTSVSSVSVFHAVTNILLENPNLNSSHLFRADIITDSAAILKTNQQKEESCHIHSGPADIPVWGNEAGNRDEIGPSPLLVEGFEIHRTVIRRLIPRKPQVDHPLMQTCHVYAERLFEGEYPGQDERDVHNTGLPGVVRHLVVYQPHLQPNSEGKLPWYHPQLKALAYLYVCSSSSTDPKQTGQGILSMHFIPLQTSFAIPDAGTITNRLDRTFVSLLATSIRLLRNVGAEEFNKSEEKSTDQLTTRDIKDSIIPEHLVQNTYTRLKEKYAATLIDRWVEKTDPSKHVFEDLSIAAFLIELWKKMYGCEISKFPGFIDIACGNGLLVYVLIMEGYSGWGFDARSRRSWPNFPESVRTHLKEAVCIPLPFLRALQAVEHPLNENIPVHNGIFPPQTFIISNHTDELTTWTPLLATLSCPSSPLPWLIIPCCSRAMSGAAHRYTPPRTAHNSNKKLGNGNSTTNKQDHTKEKTERQSLFEKTDLRISSGEHEEVMNIEEQPKVGDLKALRASKFPEQGSHGLEVTNAISTYRSLVLHVIYLAEKVGYRNDTQQTLMRIPSTRNIGIVGGGRRISESVKASTSKEHDGNFANNSPTIEEILQAECFSSGGLLEAAKIWLKGVEKIRKG